MRGEGDSQGGQRQRGGERDRGVGSGTEGWGAEHRGGEKDRGVGIQAGWRAGRRADSQVDPERLTG